MTQSMNKQLTCEICGSTDLVKTDGVFVCQSCGCKYSVEEVRRMMGICENAPEVVADTLPQGESPAETGKHKLLSNKKLLIILGIFAGAFVINALLSGSEKTSVRTPAATTEDTAIQTVPQQSTSQESAYDLHVADALPFALDYSSRNHTATFYVKDFSYTSSEAFGMSKLTIEVTIGDTEITWLRNNDTKYQDNRPYVAFWAEFLDARGNVIARSCFTPIVTVNGPDVTVSDTLFSTFLPQGTYDVAFISAQK